MLGWIFGGEIRSLNSRIANLHEELSRVASHRHCRRCGYSFWYHHNLDPARSCLGYCSERCQILDERDSLRAEVAELRGDGEAAT